MAYTQAKSHLNEQVKQNVYYFFFSIYGQYLLILSYKNPKKLKDNIFKSYFRAVILFCANNSMQKISCSCDSHSRARDRQSRFFALITQRE